MASHHVLTSFSNFLDLASDELELISKSECEASTILVKLAELGQLVSQAWRKLRTEYFEQDITITKIGDRVQKFLILVVNSSNEACCPLRIHNVPELEEAGPDYTFLADPESQRELVSLYDLNNFRRNRIDFHVRTKPVDDIAHVHHFRATQPQLFSKYYEPAPRPTTKAYQVPWHTVDRRCRVRQIDHAALGKELGCAPSPQVPVDSEASLDTIITADTAAFPTIVTGDIGKATSAPVKSEGPAHFNLEAHRDHGWPNYLNSAFLQKVTLSYISKYDDLLTRTTYRRLVIKNVRFEAAASKEIFDDQQVCEFQSQRASVWLLLRTVKSGWDRPRLSIPLLIVWRRGHFSCHKSRACNPALIASRGCARSVIGRCHGMIKKSLRMSSISTPWYTA